MRSSIRLLGAVVLSAIMPIAWPQATPGPAASTAAASAPATAPAPAAAKLPRPPQFFREEWKQTPRGGEHAVLPDSIGNPSLELKLYVPSGELELTGSASDESNPIHVWTGMCTSPCALAFREKTPLLDKVDLTRVDEIGFADLMPSSGHGPDGWSDVAQVEVFGKPVARAASGTAH